MTTEITLKPFESEVERLMVRIATLEKALKQASLRAAMGAPLGVTAIQGRGGVVSNVPVSRKELVTLQTLHMTVTGLPADQIGQAYYNNSLQEFIQYVGALSTFRNKSRLRDDLKVANYKDPLINAKLIVGAVTWAAAVMTIASASYLMFWSVVTAAYAVGLAISLLVTAAGVLLLGGSAVLGVGSLVLLVGASSVAVGAAVAGVIALAMGDPLGIGLLVAAGVAAGVALAAAGGLGLAAVGLTLGAGLTLLGLAAVGVTGSMFLIGLFIGVPLGIAALSISSTAWAGLTVAETVLFGLSASQLYGAAREYRHFIEQNGYNHKADYFAVKALTVEADANRLMAILNPVSLGLLGVFGGLIVQRSLDSWAAGMRRKILREYGSYENFIKDYLGQRYQSLSTQVAALGNEALLKNQTLDRIFLLTSVAVDSAMAQSLGKIKLSALGMSTQHYAVAFNRLLGSINLDSNYSNGWFYSDRYRNRYLGGTQYITTYGWFNSQSTSVDGRQRTQLNYQDGFANTALDLSDQIVALNSRTGKNLTQRSTVNMASGDDTVVAGVIGMNVDGGAGYDGVDYSNLMFGRQTPSDLVTMFGGSKYWSNSIATVDTANANERMTVVQGYNDGTYTVAKGSHTKAMYFAQEYVQSQTVQRGKKKETVHTLGFGVLTDFLTVTDNLSNVEWIKGSRYSDVMVGASQRFNTFMGGDGNDVLTGGDVGNALTGGAGNDTVQGGAGDDYFFSTPSDIPWNPLQARTTSVRKVYGRYVLFRFASDHVIDAGFAQEIQLNVVKPSNAPDPVMTFKLSSPPDQMNAAYFQYDLGKEYELSSIFTVLPMSSKISGYVSSYDLSAFGGDYLLMESLPGIYAMKVEHGPSTNWYVSQTVLPQDFVYQLGTDDADWIDGAGGSNMVSYLSLSNDLWRKRAGINGSDLGIAVDMAGGQVRKLGQAVSPSGLSFTDRLVNIQTVEGTQASDSFIASSLGSKFLGHGGADTLVGGLAADYLDGADGDDVLSGGAGHDIILTGRGLDTVLAGAGDDTITVQHAPVLRARYLFLRRAQNAITGVGDYVHLALKEVEVMGRSANASGAERNLMTQASTKVLVGTGAGNEWADGLYNDVQLTGLNQKTIVFGNFVIATRTGLGLYIDLGGEYDIGQIHLIGANGTEESLRDSRNIEVYASLNAFDNLAGNVVANLDVAPGVVVARNRAILQGRYILVRSNQALPAVGESAKRLTINDSVVSANAGWQTKGGAYWFAIDLGRSVDVRTIQSSLPTDAVIYVSNRDYTPYIQSDQAYQLADWLNLDDAFQGYRATLKPYSSGYAVTLTAADFNPLHSKSTFTVADFVDSNGQALTHNLSNWSDSKFIDGQQGSDTVRYDELGSHIRRALNLGVNVDLGVGLAQYWGAKSLVTDVLRNIENVTGTVADDVLMGTSVDNILQGLGGNDLLNGGAGNDMLVAGTGRSTLIGGGGDDVLAYNNTHQIQARYVLVRKRPDTGLLALQGVKVISGGQDVATAVTSTSGSDWLMLDLGKVCRIDQIALVRDDRSIFSLQAGTDLGVFLSLNAMQPSTVGYASMLADPSLLVYEDKSSLRGRYVMVRRTTPDYLALAELQVWSGGRNVATGASVVTSADGSYDAHWTAQAHLLDGLVNTSGNMYASGKSDGNSWVMVDLGQTYDIDHIKLWGRANAVSQSQNLQVLVSATLDMSQLASGSQVASHLLGRSDVYWMAFSGTTDNGKALRRFDFKNIDNQVDVSLDLIDTDWLARVRWGETLSPTLTKNAVSSFDGGDGNDVLSLANSLLDWRKATGQGVHVNLSAHVMNLAWSNGARDVANDAVAARFENVIGSAGHDELLGTSSANLLSGGDGHDLLLGLDGNDTLLGGSGNDTFKGGGGDDVLYVGHVAVRARYVLVRKQSLSKTSLVMGELQIMSNGVNVALGAVVSTSADGSWDDGWYDETNVSDGNSGLDSYQGNFKGSGIYASKGALGQSWVQIDLGAEYDIDAVHVTGRADGWFEQLGNLGVFFSTTNMGGTGLANQYEALMSHPHVSYAQSPNAVRGRYVLVRRSTADHLSLVEMQVWSGGRNVASGAAIVTSSDGTYLGATARDTAWHVKTNLLNGATTTANGMYASAKNDGSSWVMVDLGQVYDIDRLNLWGRTDGAFGQSNNVEVYVAASDLSLSQGQFAQLVQTPNLYRATFNGSRQNGQILSLAGGQFNQINVSFGTQSLHTLNLNYLEKALAKLDQFQTLDGGVGVQDMVSFAGENTAERLSTAVAGRAAMGVRAALSEGSFDNAWRIGETTFERSGSLVGIEGLLGTDQGDWLLGDAQDNILSGAGGDDLVEAGDGNDVLLGGLGRDTLRGQAGDDMFVMSETRQVVAVRYVMLRTREGDAGRLSLGGLRLLDLRGRNVLDPSETGVVLTQSGQGNLAALRDDNRLTRYEVSDATSASWVQIDLGKLTYLSSLELAAGQDADVTVYASTDPLSSQTEAQLMLPGSALFQILNNWTGDASLSVARMNALDKLGRLTQPLLDSAGDVVDGGSGTDVMDYSQRYADVRQLLDAGIVATLSTGADGQSQGKVRVWSSQTDMTSDEISSIEQIVGTDMADVMSITGSAAMAFRGGAGNDVLSGGEGNDHINGGVGADVLSGGGGDDTFIETGDLPLLQGRYLMLRNYDNPYGLQIFINGAVVSSAQITYSNTVVGSELQIDLGESRVVESLTFVNTAGKVVPSMSVFVAHHNMQGISTVDLQANVNVTRLQGLATFSQSLAVDVSAFEVANTFGAGTWNAMTSLSSLRTADTIQGGAGNDWLRYEESAVGSRVTTGRGIAADLAAKSVNMWWRLGDTMTDPRWMASVSGIENVRGTLQNDLVSGDANNNVLIGDAGADTLRGLDGDDILVDGSGSDSLEGGAGNDIFVMTSPQSKNGQELLNARYVMVRKAVSAQMTGLSLSLNQVLVMSGGVNIAATAKIIVSDGVLTGTRYVSTQADGSSWYLVDLGAVYAIDSVQVVGDRTVASSYLQVFLAQSDPSTTSLADLQQRGDVAQSLLPTAGVIQAPTFSRWNGSGQYQLGLSSRDTLEGGAGRDMISFSQSESAARLQGPVQNGVWVNLANQQAISWWNCARDGSAPNANASLQMSGVEDVQGSVASDYLIGSASDNTLYGGQGNDTLIGGSGNDTYYMGRSDGEDWIASVEGTDVLAFNTEVQAENLWYTRVGKDMKVQVLGAGHGSVVVSNFFGATAANRLAGIRFADGKALSYSSIVNLIDVMAQTVPPASGLTSIPTAYMGLRNLLTSSLK